MAANDNPVNGAALKSSVGNGISEPHFSRTQPLITPQRIKAEFLFGIPLTSSLTNETMPDDTIKSFIEQAVGEAEISLNIPIQPVRKTDSFPFERADDWGLGLRSFSTWPVLKVERLYATFPGRMPPNAALVNEAGEVDFPTSWVRLGYETASPAFNILPVAGGDLILNQAPDNINFTPFRALFLTWMKTYPHVWTVQYMAGFDFDRIPIAVNTLVGLYAARAIMSQLGPVLFPHQSYGIGIDGMSQSVATPGPAFLAQKMQEIEMRIQEAEFKLRARFGTNLIVSVF